jgi:flagellar basal-body rod protein FlgB
MNDNRVDPTVTALRIALGQASRRADVVASNIANVDTPEYRALRVQFDEILASQGDFEARRTDPGHLRGSASDAVKGRLVEAPAMRMRQDGNTVDIDIEMTLLAKTQGRYRTAAEMLRKRFALLVYTATDGRGGV